MNSTLYYTVYVYRVISSERVDKLNYQTVATVNKRLIASSESDGTSSSSSSSSNSSSNHSQVSQKVKMTLEKGK